MKEYSTIEARRKFSTLLNEVCFGKKHILITRRNEAIAAIVPLEALKALEEYAEHKVALE